jgi:hypothetical protein
MSWSKQCLGANYVLEQTMSIGSWDPSSEHAAHDFHIDTEQLRRFINVSKQNQLDQIEQVLAPDEKQVQAKLMQQDKESWFLAANRFSDEEIIDLMRFFTVAESLPGWEAGDNSPVIWLGKILKKRGTGIDKELTLWIKANSKNQFLPHGALI